MALFSRYPARAADANLGRRGKVIQMVNENPPGITGLIFRMTFGGWQIDYVDPETGELGDSEMVCENDEIEELNRLAQTFDGRWVSRVGKRKGRVLVYLGTADGEQEVVLHEGEPRWTAYDNLARLILTRDLWGYRRPI